MNFNFGLVTYALDRPNGGIRTYTRTLIGGLRAVGCEPLLLNAGDLVLGDKGVSMHGAACVPGLMTLGQFQISRHARHQELALVHDPTGLFPLSLAACKTVLTLHDAFPLVCPQTSTVSENLIYRLWLPLATHKADAVITISQHSKADILLYFAHLKEKISVIPIPHNPCFHPLPEEEIQPILERLRIPQPYLLYVGSLEPRKNLVRLLKAFDLIRKGSKGWHLVIVGARNHWKNAHISETVAALKLENSLHFTGFVQEEDLPAIYNGADLFLFPSLYEGFGLPPLEAMACGTPVITSNTSSLPEVVGNAAVMVDPYDVDAIAAAITRVLDDKALQEELRQRGLARASGFSWARMAQETIEVYQKVLDG